MLHKTQHYFPYFIPLTDIPTLKLTGQSTNTHNLYRNVTNVIPVNRTHNILFLLQHNLSVMFCTKGNKTAYKLQWSLRHCLLIECCTNDTIFDLLKTYYGCINIRPLGFIHGIGQAEKSVGSRFLHNSFHLS